MYMHESKQAMQLCWRYVPQCNEALGKSRKKRKKKKECWSPLRVCVIRSNNVFVK